MERMLIIEDEPLLQTLWEEIASAIGCNECVVVETVENALAALRSDSFDIAVLDVHLHNQISTEIAERLHELQVRTVVSTGRDIKSLPAAFHYHVPLAKPFTFSLALDAIGCDLDFDK